MPEEPHHKRFSKPFSKLKRADFERAPVWEWLDDAGETVGEDEGTDESFVRATDHKSIPRVEFGQFIVSCEMELKDSTTMPGIAELTVAQTEVAVQPSHVFLLDRKLQIPGVETNRLLARYTKQLQNFPVAWRLAVCLEGEAERRSGRIEGSDMTQVVRAGVEMLMVLRGLRR